MMNKYIKYIQSVVTGAVLLGGGIYLYVNRSQLVVLYNISVWHLMVISVLIFSFFYLSGYTFKLLVSLLSIRLSIAETLGLSILTNFANYLGPLSPGIAIKGVYLKRNKELTYTKYASILAANTLLAFFMMGSAGVIILLLLSHSIDQLPFILLLICLSLVGGSILPFIIKTPVVSKQGRISKFIQSALEGFRIIRVQKWKLLLICITFLLQFVLSACTSVVVLDSIGVSITFLVGLAIGIFVSIANVFTLTPSNLGIQELAAAYIISLCGFDFSNGLIGAGVGRVIHIIITFALAPFFSYILLKRKTSEDIRHQPFS